MTALRNIHEIVEPRFLPYLETTENPIFQQDNSRPHVARVTLDSMDQHDINQILGPPRSPDLPPNKPVWE